MKCFSRKIDMLTGEEYYEIYQRGQRLLENPLLNKGLAFTAEERHELGLEGLLRPAVSNLDAQVKLCLENYQNKQTNLERYIYLLSLQDRNETLFFRLLCDNLKEMLPIVYTPVVGEACQKMSHIMRRFRGIYLSPENISHIDTILRNISRPDLSLIVVTDGERILGLGDLGSDGMGIPVGKVNLYIAAAGLHPYSCLPVCLDVGTNNEQLLIDPMYMGWKRHRLRGDAYYELVEKFVVGVRRNFPNCLLQWEDFGKHHAFKLLERYRERILSFNDDIQGTGSTVLAALITAMQIKQSKFADQRFVIVGMGQAGTGIGHTIRALLAEEGLADEEMRRRIYAVDIQGLLLEGQSGLEPEQQPFVQRRETVAPWQVSSADKITLTEVVKNAKATVIIGVTAQYGLFTVELLREMMQYTDRPVILALSNPTTKSECTPECAAQATDGRALFATGSPFPPLPYQGKEFYTSQCNNLYIFPGVGLGALIARAQKITDQMFVAASKAISSMMTAEDRRCGLLLPNMDSIREVSFQVAYAVAKNARDNGLGRTLDNEKLAAMIRRAQWKPHYYPYRPGHP